jgi:aminoglycoside adenylyltransferase-like protein/nucleotidyltransferase-like protein
MDPRLPTALIPIVEHYLSSLDQHLPNFLRGFYTVGSIALDEFNPHFSDIDFVAVIDHRVTHEEQEWLSQIHKDIERQYSRWKFSGMYLLKDEVGKYAGEVDTLLGFHDGVLRLHHNSELNPVTWWILKNHGIPILGPPPRELPIIVDSQRLVSWTHENMKTYWKSWTRQPGRLIVLFSDWGIQWAVLGILRQFYTIRENKITAKQRAGQYALSVVPERWHRLINEALRIRTKAAGALYPLGLMRIVDTIDFLNYIIQVSDEYQLRS